jgi:hypothetical protein
VLGFCGRGWFEKTPEEDEETDRSGGDNHMDTTDHSEGLDGSTSDDERMFLQELEASSNHMEHADDGGIAGLSLPSF